MALTQEDVKEILLQLAKQQTPDRRKLQQLSPQTLRSLLEIVQQLRAQGLAGSHTRTPERLLRMYHLINQRMGRQDREPTADEIIQQMPRSARNQVLGQEALLARQSNAQAMVQAQKSMAQLNRPGLM